MDPKLTFDTKEAITNCASRFDGYAYYETIKKQGVEAPAYLDGAQRYFNSTGKLFGSPIKNMLVNFFLHRQFHHWGWMPEAYTEHWYYMVYFYLHLYRMPTPEKFKLVSMQEWENRPQGSAEAAAAEIRKMLMQRR